MTAPEKMVVFIGAYVLLGLVGIGLASLLGRLLAYRERRYRERTELVDRKRVGL